MLLLEHPLSFSFRYITALLAVCVHMCTLHVQMNLCEGQRLIYDVTTQEPATLILDSFSHWLGTNQIG